MESTSSTIGFGVGNAGDTPLGPADVGQSTDMVDESDDVVDVDANGLLGVRGGECTTRSSSECRIAEREIYRWSLLQHKELSDISSWE